MYSANHRSRIMSDPTKTKSSSAALQRSGLAWTSSRMQSEQTGRWGSKYYRNKLAVNRPNRLHGATTTLTLFDLLRQQKINGVTTTRNPRHRSWHNVVLAGFRVVGASHCSLSAHSALVRISSHPADNKGRLSILSGVCLWKYFHTKRASSITLSVETPTHYDSGRLGKQRGTCLLHIATS